LIKLINSSDADAAGPDDQIYQHIIILTSFLLL